MVLGLEKLNLSTSAQNAVIAVVLWFGWNLAKPHVAQYLPAEAVTTIDTGLVAAGSVALVALLTTIRNGVAETKQQAAQATAAASEAKILAENTKAAVEEAKAVAEVHTVQLDALAQPGGPVDQTVRTALAERKKVGES